MQAVRVVGQLQQAYMQVAAGVQGHGGVFGLQVVGGAGAEDVLPAMFGLQAVALAEALAGLDQLGVVFQAAQALPVLG